MLRRIFTKRKIDNEKQKVENLSAELFEQKLKKDKNIVLIDVRTKLEHQKVRIPNSILIDFYDPTFIQQIANLDRNKKYFLYCRSGNRSFHAAHQMLKMEFSEVYNLHTGIISWKGETERDVL